MRPASPNVMFRSSCLFALSGVLALVVGCWSGEGSRGLPCEDKLHCGLGLECINGFCGGEPSDALCGNGYLDPGEACDEGQQNAEDAACRLDCTPETCGDGVLGPSEACDQGEQNDDLGMCKTDCTPEICGDGFRGPSESCDDGNNDPDDGCSPECVNEICGDGITDPGEDCDDGDESPNCNADCTTAECGDAKLNQTAGEACDNDAPASDDALCMSNCTVPLLWDDMEPDTPDVEWSHMLVSGDPGLVPDDWSVSPRNPQGDSMRAWDSGMPAPAFGDTRLMTPALDLAPFVGETIELRFDHAWVFRDCNEPVAAYEGAVVEVSLDGGPYQVITPDDGYTGVVGDGLCAENPLDGEQAFTLDSNYITETFDLSAYAGSSIKLGFRVGWDCSNCPDNEADQSDRGWFIDNVVVSRK